LPSLSVICNFKYQDIYRSTEPDTTANCT